MAPINDERKIESVKFSINNNRNHHYNLIEVQLMNTVRHILL